MSRLAAASLLLSAAGCGFGLYAVVFVRTHAARLLRQLLAAREEIAALRAALDDCRNDGRVKWIPPGWHHSPEDF